MIPLRCQGRLKLAGANRTGVGHTDARPRATIRLGQTTVVVALLTQPKKTSVELAVLAQSRGSAGLMAVLVVVAVGMQPRQATVVVAVVMLPRQATVVVAVVMLPRQTTVVVVVVMAAIGKDGNGTLGTNGADGSQILGGIEGGTLH